MAQLPKGGLVLHNGAEQQDSKGTMTNEYMGSCAIYFPGGISDLLLYFKFWYYCKTIRYYKSSSSTPPQTHFVLNIFIQTSSGL